MGMIFIVRRMAPIPTFPQRGKEQIRALGAKLARFIRFLLLALALPLATQAQTLMVSAAASLTDALREIGSQFEAGKPGTTVRFNFAASGVLLQQIGQGAPVDVLASADQETMDRAAARGLIDAATRRDFAANSLVLIEPSQGGIGLKTLQDLARPEVRKIAIGKPDTVPAGRYTRQALEAAGLWASLAPRFVQANSARQALSYVSRGEAEAGFVYRSDAALAGDKVRVALTAAGHAPVSYPVAVVAESPNKALGQEFIAFLATPQARAVLARLGFGKP
jgi:molybdate transport system substrate-binding protein